MFFFYIICCLIATMIGAICGVGGGIIIRPILDAVSGLPISEIGFLSGCTVLSMSAASLLTSEKSNMVADKKHTVWLAIGAAIGGVIGKRLFVFIKLSISAEGILGVIQSVLLVLLILGTFVYMLYRPCIQTKKSEAFP